MSLDVRVTEYLPLDFEGLAEMYQTWDPLQSSQGVPPVASRLRAKWLSALLAKGLNWVARSGDEVVGHAVLMPDDAGAWELAVFVRRDHQSGGIGTALIERLLVQAQTRRIRQVWMSVESGGRAAQCCWTRGFQTDVDDGWQTIRRLTLPGDGEPVG